MGFACRAIKGFLFGSGDIVLGMTASGLTPCLGLWGFVQCFSQEAATRLRRCLSFCLIGIFQLAVQPVVLLRRDAPFGLDYELALGSTEVEKAPDPYIQAQNSEDNF